MSIQEKIEKYSQAHQSADQHSGAGKEILEGFRQLITEIKDENALPETTKERLTKLHEAFLKLPQIFFYNHSQELLETIFELASDNIYKAFFDISFDFQKPQVQDLQLQTQDHLVLFFLVNYLDKIKVKELFGFLKEYNQKKKKNPQLKLILIELLHHILLMIDKKELNLGDLLPTLLRVLNPSLAKYIRYKAKVDKNQYGEVPKNIAQYLLNYENWTKALLQKIMKTLVLIINPQKGQNRLLLVNDLYEMSATKSDLKKKTPSNEKLVTHYCLLAIFDILEGLIDCRGNAYFLKENIDSFIENIMSTLLEIHPNLHDYVANYLLQLKLKKIDDSIAAYNRKDEYNLQVGNYDKLTIYNAASISFLAIKLIQSPKETILLTAEYKLQLLLPCLYVIFADSLEKHDLKSDLVSTSVHLFQALNARKGVLIDNLNKFGVPLDKVVERMLDFTGGSFNEKDKSLGIDLFVNVRSLLTERALANLLISAIVDSRAHGLFSYLFTEYKTGITNTLKSYNSVQEIKESNSVYLNAGLFKKLMEVGLDSSFSKFKNNNDLISCCVNILTLVYLKLGNFAKQQENYASLAFKDPSNLFNPVNLKILLNYGEKVQGLSAKVNDEMKACKNNMDKFAKENPESSQTNLYQIQLNEFFMILDSIDRISEIYTTLKESFKIEK